MLLTRHRFLYIPALVIVATVSILLFVIAVSTYRNRDREIAKMEETLVREGRAITRAIEAAIRADSSDRPPELGRLNKLLADIGRDPDISGVAIADASGRTIASSSPGGKERPLGGGSFALLLQEKGLVTRYEHDQAGERIFEIIQPLQPFFVPHPLTPRRAGEASPEQEPLAAWSKDKIIEVGFRLRVFEASREEDVRHILLMAAILIILGTGTLYFIFIVQKYYRDLREIHELKERVRESEHLASLGRLAAGVAHEIRNPLSSIRGFAQFFMNRLRGHKEEEEYAAIMVKEVDRLNRVITELLNFAHPKKLKREPCSLAGIIDYALQVLAMELERKRVRVERKYVSNLPLIPADQEQLSQAFLNLLLNALEALEEKGEITVEIGEDVEKGMIRIVVADNGRGIPSEDLGRIFEPFFSTKRKGTGLGLAIVRQIIESHGGTIKAENRESGGTIFVIRLPLLSENASRRRETSEVSEKVG